MNATRLDRNGTRLVRPRHVDVVRFELELAASVDGFVSDGWRDRRESVTRKNGRRRHGTDRIDISLIGLKSLFEESTRLGRNGMKL